MTPRFAPLLSLLVIAAGCGPSRPKRIVPPDLDPEAVTAAVMVQADADRDGTISKRELAGVPALVSAAPALDTNGDGGLSAAEVREWLDQIKASRVAITSFSGRVTHLKRPLAGAEVKLVPESFMGAGMQAAGGVTDAEGLFSATIPNATYPGVNCGLYRVEITGQGNDGKPLAARYNAQTTLGVAVGGAVPENGSVDFSLE